MIDTLLNVLYIGSFCDDNNIQIYLYLYLH